MSKVGASKYRESKLMEVFLEWVRKIKVIPQWQSVCALSKKVVGSIPGENKIF